MMVDGVCVYALQSLWLVYTHGRKQNEAKRGGPFRIPEKARYYRDHSYRIPGVEIEDS